MQNILGISLGTRFMGMAVMYDGELTEFRTRTFYNRWTEGKRKEMIAVLQKTVDRYGITKIAIKLPKPFHCSQNIQWLMHDIRRLSEQQGIQVATCTITELKQRYTSNERGNKQALVQAIINGHPERKQLAAIAARKQAHRKLNCIKIFEAIACAELAV